MRAQKGNVFFDIVKPTQRCIDLICPGFKIPSRRNRSRVCLSNVIKSVRGLPRATSSHGDLPRRKRRMIGDDRYLNRSRYRSDNPFPSSVRVIKEKFCGEKENDLIREGGRPPSDPWQSRIRVDTRFQRFRIPYSVGEVPPPSSVRVYCRSYRGPTSRCARYVARKRVVARSSHVYTRMYVYIYMRVHITNIPKELNMDHTTA